MATIFNSKNLMVDIECLGSNCNAPIIQIGAVLFSKELGIEKEYLANIAYDFHDFKRYEADYSTIMWWMSQDKAVINSLGESCKIIYAALMGLMQLDKNGDSYWWAKSTIYDIAIIENALKTENIPFKIPFRNVVDMRDIHHLLGYPKAKKPAEGAHNALADAKAQAIYVLEWMYSLKKESI